MSSKNYSQILVPILIVLSLMWIAEAGLTRSERTLRCHICDAETCKNFNKKAEAQNCTVGGLIPENNGPSKLYKLSTINFVPHENPNPSFACQKIEGYDSLGNLNVVRRCQMRVSGNESCSMFYRNNNEDPDKSFRNVSCSVCETDGCNSSGSLYVWFSLLFGSTILSFFI